MLTAALSERSGALRKDIEIYNGNLLYLLYLQLVGVAGDCTKYSSK